jgi:hypothetical protein
MRRVWLRFSPFRCRDSERQQSGESRLEPEIGASFGQSIDLLQNQTACGYRGKLSRQDRVEAATGPWRSSPH